MKRPEAEKARLLCVLAACVVAIAGVRARLVAVHQRVKDQHEVYFLPPAGELVRASLGYKAAVADLLWAHIMVSQGLHTFERRRFENLSRLYDAIGELDPTWRTPYLYADAFFTFQTSAAPYEDVVKARQILERGVRARPTDAEIWLNLGQFVGFVAPSSYLDDRPAEAERWRRETAAMLARAVELSGESSYIGWQAVAGAHIFDKAGQHEAAIRFLLRALAVTDDEELKGDILRRLRRMMAQRDLAAHQSRMDAFERIVKSELPFIRKTLALVLGPPVDPARCAGPGRDEAPACAHSWERWSQLQGGQR
ncbi:MAG: hypothetical protein HY744_06340 [Deltaproteobacteria bacterium]|nr:hypothetical protein [Deltaproteobacteria bacterium]